MSFITRCPSCGTAFKVVPDQLKISEGWVRCGQCQHVFDATLDLQPWWPGAELVDLNAPQDDAQAEPADDEPTQTTVWHDGPTVTPEHATVDASIEPDDRWSAPVFADEVVCYTPATPPEPETVSAWDAHDTDDSGPVAAATDQSSFTFVRQAQRKAFWRRTGVRAALSGIALVLLLSLGLQWLVLQRDVLATQVPALQPVLEALCRPLGCRVGAGQRLDQFAIDSSALLRRAPDRFAFDMVLKNAAAQALATPSLELTLTDAQDAVVVRRVFAPAEWPQAPLTLPARSEHPIRLELALDAAQAQPVVGYRAILFYP
ncbi:MAG TPA: zinc-ribbon and DUF3426 domain-containing protein [Macromonas sp.]|nr:zinc-ribbon and DUF3426 domain-containing protein [Macromonas sp.]